LKSKNQSDTLRSNFLTACFVHRYTNIPDEWTLPEPQEYKDQGNLHSYLLDPDAYDQYYVMSGGGNLVQIWQNCAPEPVVVEERPVRFFPLHTS